MKKRNIFALVIVGIVLIPTIIFMALTSEIVYEQKPDPLIFNKDVNNMKHSPFIVDKGEYPFKSNWFEKDGVSMHYLDEGEGIPIVLTHGNPDWSFLNRNIWSKLHTNLPLSRGEKKHLNDLKQKGIPLKRIRSKDYWANNAAQFRALRLKCK